MEKRTIAVGDTVLIPVKVLAVHHQGFPLGMHANGSPNVPTHAGVTQAEIDAAKVERPDTIEFDLACEGGTMKLFLGADKLSG